MAAVTRPPGGEDSGSAMAAMIVNMAPPMGLAVSIWFLTPMNRTPRNPSRESSSLKPPLSRGRQRRPNPCQKWTIRRWPCRLVCLCADEPGISACPCCTSFSFTPSPGFCPAQSRHIATVVTRNSDIYVGHKIDILIKATPWLREQSYGRH